MKQKIVAYLKDESGQTSTEYILLVAVAAFALLLLEEDMGISRKISAALFVVSSAFLVLFRRERVDCDDEDDFLDFLLVFSPFS